MKAAIPYKVLYFLRLYISEYLLVSECLILEIYSKYNLYFSKQFTKCCFKLWFYNAIKTMGKRKEEDDTFLRKNKENSKEPSSSTISTEASINDDSNEETLNINQQLQKIDET